MDQPDHFNNIVDATGKLQISELVNGELRIRYCVDENLSKAEVIFTWVYDDEDMEPVVIRVDAGSSTEVASDSDTSPPVMAMGPEEFETCLENNIDMGIKAIIHCLPQIPL